MLNLLVLLWVHCDCLSRRPISSPHLPLSGNIIKQNGIYFMYGEHYGNSTGFDTNTVPTLIVYHSPDMVNWVRAALMRMQWAQSRADTGRVPAGRPQGLVLCAVCGLQQRDRPICCLVRVAMSLSSVIRLLTVCMHAGSTHTRAGAAAAILAWPRRRTAHTSPSYRSTRQASTRRCVLVTLPWHVC